MKSLKNNQLPDTCCIRDFTGKQQVINEVIIVKILKVIHFQVSANCIPFHQFAKCAEINMFQNYSDKSKKGGVVQLLFRTCTPFVIEGEGMERKEINIIRYLLFSHL